MNNVLGHNSTVSFKLHLVTVRQEPLAREICMILVLFLISLEINTV